LPAIERQAWVVSSVRDAAAADPGPSALGAVLRPLGPAAALAEDGPGVLLFDHADDGLLAMARDLSRGGRRRVLAIATEPDVVAGAVPWTLLEAGATDVIAWDGTTERVASRLERWRLIDELVASPLVAEQLVGTSPSWRAVLAEIVEIARFSDANVLITGESGTGKELSARLVHALDPRPGKGDLVVLDCTTIVASLSGSELFGHERGAFTGADSSREGAFALADGGTLFLDEVGELAPAMQIELLRVVQEGTFKRVGSDRWQRTSFRLVCATNRDLAAARAAGAFRSDLFFRLAAATITLPPLRERPEDVLALARHFLVSNGTPAPPISEAVCDLLQSRDYPGNVRDLKQFVARIRARHVGPGPVTAGAVPPDERPTVARARGWRADLDTALHRAVALGVPLRDIVDASRDGAIHAALTGADGSVRRAARRLGVTDRTLQLHRARRRGPPS
jgi:transcriptional regulator with GAF, ATPase, and Fis domain